jgi:hypothetical protein
MFKILLKSLIINKNKKLILLSKIKMKHNDDLEDEYWITRKMPYIQEKKNDHYLYLNPNDLMDETEETLCTDWYNNNEIAVSNYYYFNTLVDLIKNNYCIQRPTTWINYTWDDFKKDSWQYFKHSWNPKLSNSIHHKMIMDYINQYHSHILK